MPTTVNPIHSKLIRRMSRNRVACGFFAGALPFLLPEGETPERLGVICRFRFVGWDGDGRDVVMKAES